MDPIESYSLNLANNLVKCNVEEYFTIIHNEFYQHINTEFMDYFLSLVPKKHEFCIEHQKLQEYKVLNNIKSSNIKDCLNKINLHT